MVTPKDNSINYCAGPVDLKLNLEAHRIEITCSSYYNNMWEFCFETLMPMLDINREDIIQISENFYIINYNIEILENYLNNSLYFGEELEQSHLM